MIRAGIIDCIGSNNLFRNLDTCVQDIQNDNLGALTSSPGLGAFNLRRKKSSFFNAPVVGSPLLRGLTKLKM
jgi:hypothetical protein